MLFLSLPHLQWRTVRLLGQDCKAFLLVSREMGRLAPVSALDDAQWRWLEASQAANHADLRRAPISKQQDRVPWFRAVACWLMHTDCVPRLTIHGGYDGSSKCTMELSNLKRAHLDLSACDLGVDAVLILSQFFSLCKAPRALLLASNPLTGVGDCCDMCDAGDDDPDHPSADYAGLRALLRSLGEARLHGVTCLSVADTALGSEGLELVASQLRLLPSLTSLDVSSNSVMESSDPGSGAYSSMYGSWDGKQSDGLVKFSHQLPSSITALSVASNSLGPGGTRTLATALCTMPQMTDLDISDNDMCNTGKIYDPSGLEALCEAVQKMSLTCLRLMHNGLRPRGAEILAESIGGGGGWREMLYLGLAMNKLAHEKNGQLRNSGLQMLLRALSNTAHVPAMQRLDLLQNQISNDGHGARCVHLIEGLSFDCLL